MLDIQQIASFTDYFIICSGTSDRMLHSLADVVENTARTQLNIKTKAMGAPESGWMTVDLDDIVVHVFSPDQRDYYRLEELWNEGKVLVRLK